MSAELRQVRPEDADEICDFLHVHMNARISRANWRRILVDYPWRVPGSDLGCVAVDRGRIVGFFGVMHTERQIDGALARIANLTTWYLLKPYRGTGLNMPMLGAVTRAPGVTYTNFTSDRPVLRLFDRAKFRVLDDRRFLWQPSGRRAQKIEVLDDPAAIRDQLVPEARALLDDHAGFNLRAYLIRAAEGACLVMLAVMVKGDDIAYHEVLHLSDKQIFARHVQAFADRVLPPEQAVLAVDSRLLHGVAVAAQSAPLPVPRYFKSAHVEPWQVDFLYSEIILLDLKLF